MATGTRSRSSFAGAPGSWTRPPPRERSTSAPPPAGSHAWPALPPPPSPTDPTDGDGTSAAHTYRQIERGLRVARHGRDQRGQQQVSTPSALQRPIGVHGEGMERRELVERVPSGLLPVPPHLPVEPEVRGPGHLRRGHPFGQAPHADEVPKT